mgnify:FL=1
MLNRKAVSLTKQNNFDLHPLSSAGYECNSVIHLHNPNLLSSTIITMDEKYSINGVSLGLLSIELNQGIPGLKETEFPVSVRFSKADFLKAVDSDSTLPTSINLLVEGEIKYQNLTGNGTIKVYHTENISTKGL